MTTEKNTPENKTVTLTWEALNIEAATRGSHLLTQAGMTRTDPWTFEITVPEEQADDTYRDLHQRLIAILDPADLIKAKLRTGHQLTGDEADTLLALIDMAEDVHDDGTPEGRKAWATADINGPSDPDGNNE